jgi:hypothetical protein
LIGSRPNLLFAAILMTAACTPDRSDPQTKITGDLDGNGFDDQQDCIGFDAGQCEVRCPICAPGSASPGFQCQGPCTPNVNRVFCQDDEDVALAEPTVDVAELNIIAVGMDIPSANPSRCENDGYLWRAVANYFGETAEYIRVAYRGVVVYEGSFERFTVDLESENSTPVSRARLVRADVCVPFPPPSASERMAAQLLTDDGASMIACGGAVSFDPDVPDE